MPTATALRSFQHGADRYKKGDDVEYDAQTLKALARSGLVSKEVVEGNEPPPPKVETSPKATKGKGGKKSSASPAAQASPPPTLPPLQPGVPPPLPDVQ